MSSRRFLWLLVGVVVAVALFSVFIIDRFVWFDESFTTLTVLRMDTRVVDFSHYDVHPSGYYISVWLWHLLNPGVPLHMWLRLFSTLMACVFMYFVGSFVFKAFGDDWASRASLLLMSLSTTVALYATEARMYMFVMALSALLLWLVTEDKVRYWVVVLITVCLPFIHYFAVICVGFIGLVMVAWHGRKALKGLLLMWGFGALSAVFAFLLFARPQLQRMEKMWFQSPDVLSAFSGLFYPFQVIADTPLFMHGVLLSTVFLLLFVTAIGYSLFLLWRELDVEDAAREYRIMAAMMISAAAPVIGVMLGKLISIYHHRFFLAETWMLVPVVYVLLIRRFRVLAYVIGVVTVFSLVLFMVQADTELRDMWRVVPCEEGVVVAHQSAWTYHTFEVYNKEYCGLQGNIMLSSITERQGHSAGYDVLDPSTIYWDSTYPTNVSFYYVDGGSDYSGLRDRAVLVREFPNGNLTFFAKNSS